ncbi:hypothetical protein GUITHDRAFT_107138 [Guillardia theta CCMP2712]|uniref:Uncharacterized protein n=1 Tax=Guillardia theta (strain CCMP2712) TaxID=905079 RepID=L1JFX6_GUITC|nr:hypothetical protein GUITHDRAFT_107138 [Guillardia theta CCMP2712]EKX47227.1 hypothetical protein GUITHDRAFT_107138 [Guillardia theta CCMP2712]|eukprot:XP_005834207.1 hypothetical protein GUITHDRAFT_107138 [Guillardia theta CCMP2712]
MQLLRRFVWSARRSLHTSPSGLHPRVHSFTTATHASSRYHSFTTDTHTSSRYHSFTTATHTSSRYHSFTTDTHASSRYRASTYLKHACELLEIKDPNGTAYVVALALNDKDAEKQLQLQKAENYHQIIVNYYKRQVSYISQRYLVEDLFRKAMDIIANSEDGGEEINSVQKGLPRKDLELMIQRQLSMRSMNRHLQTNNSLRLAVWKRIGLPEDLLMPGLSEEKMLYGYLSEHIHGPTGLFVFLSSRTAKEEIRFFSEVAHVFKKEVDFFDDASAEEGELMETKSILEKHRRKSEDDSEPKP